MKVTVGMFVHYLYGNEKFLAQILNLYDKTAEIVLRDIHKIPNTSSDYRIYSFVCEVPFYQLIPIKGIA